MANFIPLTSAGRLAELFEESNQKPIIFFKHSTTCPISMSVYQEVAGLDADVQIIVVQNSRPISAEIAERVKINHESPQAIIIKDGKPIYTASHFDITAEDINAAISEA